LPVEITDLNVFAEIARRAIECRIKRGKGNTVKVKARTKRYLYTYKTTEDQLQDVLNKIQCKNVVDVDKKVKSQKT
jgi:large subunit ribosomal protein L38e